MHPLRLHALAAMILWSPLGAAAEPTAPAPAPAPARTTIVAGIVSDVDLAAHRFTVETATSAKVQVGWDRNTLVYQPGGATTSAALRRGAAVRAGVGATPVAYWIQVRASSEPAAPPPRLPGAQNSAPPPRPPGAQNSTPPARP